MSEYTPGPWEWNGYSGIIAQVNGPNHPLDPFPNEKPYVADIAIVCDAKDNGGGDLIHYPEAGANARLLAAAPELLEACKLQEKAERLEKTVFTDDYETLIVEAAQKRREAIAKAEGENE